MVAADIWIEIFQICLSLSMAIWIPLKLLYFQDPMWFDYVLEGICVFSFFFEIRLFGWKKRRLLALGWAFPLFTCVALSPFDTTFPTAFLLLNKFLFVPRILKVRNVLEKFDNLHPVFYRLITIGTVVPVIIHSESCIWVALGSGTAGPDANHVAEYVKALYWTLTTLTTVGYGDITAKTIPQMLFSGASEVIGVAFFGFVLSNIAALLARLDGAREQYLSTLDQVESFIRYNDLPQDFRTKIRGYYRYLWERHRGFDDKSILESLPRLLRSQATFHMNKDIVPKVPFLKNAPQDLLEDVVFQLKPQIVTPGEHLFYRGEVGDTMFFIHHGQVDILGDGGQVLVSLKDGAFFGEMALLLDAPRNASAVAASYCDLFYLEKAAFEGVMTKHPQFRKHIEDVVHSRTVKKTAS